MDLTKRASCTSGRRRGRGHDWLPPGSNNRGYVNLDPSQPGPRCAGGGYFLAAFFLRSAQ